MSDELTVINKQVFVVGEITAQLEEDDEAVGVTWELVGVFTDEQAAVDVVTNDSQFVGPVELNRVLPEMVWPGIYFPMLTEES